MEIIIGIAGFVVCLLAMIFAIALLNRLEKIHKEAERIRLEMVANRIEKSENSDVI